MRLPCRFRDLADVDPHIISQHLKRPLHCWAAAPRHLPQDLLTKHYGIMRSHVGKAGPDCAARSKQAQAGPDYGKRTAPMRARHLPRHRLNRGAVGEGGTPVDKCAPHLATHHVGSVTDKVIDRLANLTWIRASA